MSTLNREKRALLIALFVITGIIFLWRACTLPPVTSGNGSTYESARPHVTDSAFVDPDGVMNTGGKGTPKASRKKSGKTNVAKPAPAPSSPLEKPVTSR